MLTEYDETLSLLGNSLSHKARILVETVDVTFVARVKQDRSRLWVPVLVIDQIANLEFVRVPTSAKVVNIHFKEVLRRVLSISESSGKQGYSKFLHYLIVNV